MIADTCPMTCFHSLLHVSVVPGRGTFTAKGLRHSTVLEYASQQSYALHVCLQALTLVGTRDRNIKHCSSC